MTVLSLAKVTTGAAAASYCEDASDYYVDDHSPSQWWGKGATSLRLDGAVDPACFRAPLDGEMPDGSVLHNAAEGRRGGTDLTFSAPKSVSLQALVGDDATLIDAHENAVRKALSYAETLASYRMTEDGVTRPEPSKNLVVAMFRHDLSRATDPPLHTHAVVINATERSDGQWRALDQSEFYRQQKLIGALYRAELALEVQQLGYSIRLTHADGRFELAHFTPEQIEAFSGRSRAIEAALEQIGKTRAEATAHEKEMATLATRDKKTEVDRMALRARWREQSRELGIEYAPTKRVMKVSSAQRRNAARESLRYAVAHTTERQAIVTEPQLLRAAFEQGTGQTDLITVRQELARAVRKGELLHFNQCYTTPEAQQLEREILAVERRGRSAVTPIANRWQAQERVGKNVLNEEQRKAALLIVTADARVSAIQGSAGTGKTTMLASAREVAESNGYHMIGLAPSAAAARELHKAGIESQTLAAFSHRTDQMLNERSILVLDEAGMMATRDMHAVLRRAETWGARVVLVGDVQQLKAIEAGKPFAQLQAAGIARVEMKSIQRQTNAELRTAVELAAKGEVTRSLFTLAPHVVEIDYATARYQAMAKDFASLDETSRASTLIVAGTRAAREAINTQVRQQLGLAGRGVTFSALKRKDMTRAQARSSVSYQVGEIVQANKRYASLGLKRGEFASVLEAADGRVMLERADGKHVEWRPALQTNMVTYHAHERELAIGDVVRFTANDYRHHFINGERAIVCGIDPTGSSLMLAKSDGSSFTLDVKKHLPLEHGYCSTVHSAQGQTSERILIEADTRSVTSNESAYYVAISRARSVVKIYTDDKHLLPAVMSRTDGKVAALELHQQVAPVLGR